MELSVSEVVYLAMAVRNMLAKDLKNTDRVEYEKLWFRLKISHSGQQIRSLFKEVANDRKYAYTITE